MDKGSSCCFDVSSKGNNLYNWKGNISRSALRFGISEQLKDIWNA